jgi:hypothetical protein
MAEMAEPKNGHVIESSLGFSIWLPDGWEIAEVLEEAEDVAKEAKAEFERWRTAWMSNLSQEDRELITWGSEVGPGRLLSLLEGLEPNGRAVIEAGGGLSVITVNTYSDPEASRAARAFVLLTVLSERQKDSLRTEPLELLTAYLRIESEDPGSPEIEISRYQLKRPLDAISFYAASKPSQSALSQGKRPSHVYLIDGMEAIRFYCQFAGEPARKAFFYFAAADTIGWQFDCWADTSHFDRLKPIFIQITESFQRSS